MQAASLDRRWLTAGLALLVHSGLAVSVLSIPSSEFDGFSHITQIVLIPAPMEADPQAPELPDVEDIPQPDIAEETAAPEPVESVTSEPAHALPVSARAAPVETDAASNAADAYPLSTGTRSVLQGLQCPGDPESFAQTGICPQAARRNSRMAAAGETVGDFYTIDVAAIRAAFGIAPHALAGQATLGDGNRTGGLANSNSMRDVLPASRRDPAFGD